LVPIADAPSTPKTNFQLAEAIKQPKNAEYTPFGRDFEDTDSYSPVISRLLFYAEIHNCTDHGYGTFSAPKQIPPYTYKQLQEWIRERRRRQASDATERAPQQLVTSAEDLATKLRQFASDGIVVAHLIEFALSSKKRTNATEVTPTVASAALANGIETRGAATEHAMCTDETQDAGDDAQQLHVEHRTADDVTACAINDIAAHPTSNATEHATKQKKHLKKYDDSRQTGSYDVTLSQSAAKAMADDFFKFIKQESRLGYLICSRIAVDRGSRFAMS